MTLHKGFCWNTHLSNLASANLLGHVLRYLGNDPVIESCHAGVAYRDVVAFDGACLVGVVPDTVGHALAYGVG